MAVFLKLLVLLTLVAILEMLLLLALGRWIGFWPTMVIVIATSIIGVIMARTQGRTVFKRLQEEMSTGVFPGEEVVNGILIIVGAFFLITPGLITDVLGYLCLSPRPRRWIFQRVKSRLEHMPGEGNASFFRR